MYNSVNYNDKNNYKKCYLKLHDIYMCMPPKGTVVINYLEFPDVVNKFGGKAYFNITELDEMKVTNRNMFSYIKGCIRSGSASVVTSDKCFVLFGTMGELSTAGVSDIIGKYDLVKGGKGYKITNELLGSLVKGDIIPWSLLSINSDYIKNSSFVACFIPEHQVGQITTYKGVQNINDKRVSTGHGLGDFLVCSVLPDGNMDLRSRVVVNGNVFGKTYNNRNWSDYINVSTENFMSRDNLPNLIKGITRKDKKPTDSSQINYLLNVSNKLVKLCRKYLINGKMDFEGFENECMGSNFTLPYINSESIALSNNKSIYGYLGVLGIFEYCILSDILRNKKLLMSKGIDNIRLAKKDDNLRYSLELGDESRIMCTYRCTGVYLGYKDTDGESINIHLSVDNLSEYFSLSSIGVRVEVGIKEMGVLVNNCDVYRKIKSIVDAFFEDINPEVMTESKMKRVLKNNIRFSELKKNNGIYEFYTKGDKSIGISFEDDEEGNPVYIYNIFLGDEYINISSRGTVNSPVTDFVVRDLVESWNIDVKNESANGGNSKFSGKHIDNVRVSLDDDTYYQDTDETYDQSDFENEDDLNKSILKDKKIENVTEDSKKTLDISDYAKQGFDSNQLEQIERGLKSDIDVSIYANPDFSWKQMSTIRIGLEEGLDASIYAKPEFNDNQMEQIYAGLSEGLDVSIYANPEFYDVQMREIRLGLEEGLNVSIYAKPEFDCGQMKYIRLGLEGGLDVSIYAKPEFICDQMIHIYEGLKEGLDVSIYANPDFYDLQMYEIRLGLEKGLDVSIYAKPEIYEDKMKKVREYLEKLDGFDRNQILQIGEGLVNDIDVSIYANREFSAEQMELIREGLEEGVNVSTYADTRFDYNQMLQIVSGLINGIDVSSYANPEFSSEQMEKIRLDLEKQ